MRLKIKWPYNWAILFILCMETGIYMGYYLLEVRQFKIFFVFALVSEGALTFLVVVFFLKAGFALRRRR
jgi:hypothetical protein